jgi:predicted transport protein
VLRNRPPELVKLYAAVEAFVRKLGRVEFVTRERYVLLRTLRIFTDLVIMRDAVRIAIHLQRKVDDPRFFKVVTDGRKVTHVAKLKSLSDLKAIQPLIREAYELSIAADARNNL